MVRSDHVDVIALLDHRLHRPELVERMQGFAPRIFGKAVVFCENSAGCGFDDARNRSVLREPLLLHQQVESAKPPATSRNFEIASVLARSIENGPHVEAVQEPAPRDIVRELLDRSVTIDAPDIGLGQNQPVERDVARRVEGNFRCCFSHGISPWRVAGRLSPGIGTRHEGRRAPLPLISRRRDEQERCEPGAALYSQSYHNYDRSDAYSDGYSRGTEQRGHETDYRDGQGPGAGYGPAAKVNDLLTMRAASADVELQKRGFRTVNAYQAGDTSYTIRANDRTGQCVQVATQDGRIRYISDIKAKACR